MSYSPSKKCASAVGSSLVFLIILFVPAGAKAGADDLHWQPAKTRVFIASLCWYKGEKKPDFALDERLDGKMAEFFQNRGVPKQQIMLLLDGQASTQKV